MDYRYKEVRKLTDLMHEYDAFIFDIWGVLHDGGELFENTAKTFNELSKNKIVRIITNAPRRASSIVRSLGGAGLDVQEDQVFTSGDNARFLLNNSSEHLGIDKPVIYHIGADRNTEVLTDLDNSSFTTNIEESNIIVVSAFRNHIEDCSDISEELKEGVKLNRKLICTNPDVRVMHQGTLRKCAGYFANEFQELGGIVIHSGKPEKIIFQRCLNSFDHEGKRILMIGDTFGTDIEGAIATGIDSGLVLTGNMNLKMLDNNMPNNIESANKIIELEESKPTHIVSL